MIKNNDCSVKKSNRLLALYYRETNLSGYLHNQIEEIGNEDSFNEKLYLLKSKQAIETDRRRLQIARKLKDEFGIDFFGKDQERAA